MLKQLIIFLRRLFGFRDEPSVLSRASYSLAPLDGKDPFRIDLFKTKQKGPYHVIIINDGQDIDQLGITSARSAYRQLPPLLLVAIQPRDRMQDYGTQRHANDKGLGKDAAHYARWLLETLRPFLNDRYTLASAKWTIFGCSLGGLSAFDIAYHDPQVFGTAGICSGSFWWRDAPYNPEFPDAHRTAIKIVDEGSYHPVRFWFQTGTNDEIGDRNGNGVIDAIDDTLDLIHALKKKGWSDYDLTYVEIEGGKHDYNTWRPVFPDFLTWAFAK